MKIIDKIISKLLVLITTPLGKAWVLLDKERS
jgi:hypothetical protein